MICLWNEGLLYMFIFRASPENEIKDMYADSTTYFPFTMQLQKKIMIRNISTHFELNEVKCTLQTQTETLTYEHKVITIFMIEMQFKLTNM